MFGETSARTPFFVEEAVPDAAGSAGMAYASASPASLIVVQRLPQALAGSMVVTGEHFTLGAARVRPSSLRGISPEVPTATWLCI